MVCSHCGASLPDSLRFCTVCGRAAGASGDGQPAPPVPPPATTSPSVPVGVPPMPPAVPAVAIGKRRSVSRLAAVAALFALVVGVLVIAPVRSQRPATVITTHLKQRVRRARFRRPSPRHRYHRASPGNPPRRLLAPRVHHVWAGPATRRSVWVSTGWSTRFRAGSMS